MVKVFISWSGEPSRSIARSLRSWLRTVAQHLDPWMSDEEIRSGVRWNDQVAKALEASNFGIVCLTSSNQEKPWLMFEAGALVKHLNVSRLVPLCIDLTPAEITGPLDPFQSRELNEQGMRELLRDLMKLRNNPPTDEETNRLFARMWPDFYAEVQTAQGQQPINKIPRKSRDMLEELVERVRRIERELTLDLPQAVGPEDYPLVTGYLSRWFQNSLTLLDRGYAIAPDEIPFIPASVKRRLVDEYLDHPSAEAMMKMLHLLARREEQEQTIMRSTEQPEASGNQSSESELT